MTQVTFVLVFFVVVMLLAFSLYHHKKHIEFKMSDTRRLSVVLILRVSLL